MILRDDNTFEDTVEAMFNTILLPLLAAAAFAVPLEERQSGPSVTIANGTLIGSTSRGVDSFLGIPFAQPPVGDLRLRKPLPLAEGFGTRQATQPGRACPQFGSTTNTEPLPADALARLQDTPLGLETSSTGNDPGEDCLTIDVVRPSDANADSNLPILFWIYGGGFSTGSTGMYDGSNLVRKSVSLAEPVIYVAVNYRLGGFGFLGGNDLSEEGANTNLGLRDQRLGLEWVQDNIAQFGGDPTKVTIWGESAGAISVQDQTIINGGDNTYNGQALFRGAIMNSGSMIPAAPVTGVKSNTVYDTVVRAAGCQSASNKLACLRALPYEAYLNAANSVPSIFSYQSVDLAYLPRPDPADNFFALSPNVAVNSGQYARVPQIVGNQEDEGTLFSLVPLNVTSDADLTTYISDYFRPNNPNAVADTERLLVNYPNRPLVGQPDGSPFRTGITNSITPQFKRLAAILGDFTFTLTRRVYLTALESTSDINTWTYLATYFYGTPILGTFHASDVPFSFGNFGNNPITDSIQTYYLSFVNHLDPNTARGRQIEWPQWTNSSRDMLSINFAASNRIIRDDFREAAFTYLFASQASFVI